MYETLLRPHEVSQIPKLESVSVVSQRLQAAERKREEKRLKQIANAKSRNAAGDGRSGKRKRDSDGDEEVAGESSEGGNKRVRTDEEEEAEEPRGVALQVDVPPTLSPSPLTTEVQNGPEESNTVTAVTRLHVSKALQEVRGHTSYLTFACLLPPDSLTTSLPTDLESPDLSVTTAATVSDHHG